MPEPYNKPASNRAAFIGMCVLVVLLQGADAYSTFAALDTGMLVERNELLNRIAYESDLPIKWVVLLAKLLVVALFFLVMLKTKATRTNLAVLICFAAFYIHVIAENIYWINMVKMI
jgi:hypothetical protein